MLFCAYTVVGWRANQIAISGAKGDISLKAREIPSIRTSVEATSDYAGCLCRWRAVMDAEDGKTYQNQSIPVCGGEPSLPDAQRANGYR